MGDVKPGDKVWLGPLLLTDDGEAYQLVDDKLIDGAIVAPWQGNMLLDSPCLPAVAAMLTEPGLAAAVQDGIDGVTAWAGDWSVDSDTVTQLRRSTELLQRLAAALNGGIDGK